MNPRTSSRATNFASPIFFFFFFFSITAREGTTRRTFERNNLSSSRRREERKQTTTKNLRTEFAIHNQETLNTKNCIIEKIMAKSIRSKVKRKARAEFRKTYGTVSKVSSCHRPDRRLVVYCFWLVMSVTLTQLASSHRLR